MKRQSSIFIIVEFKGDELHYGFISAGLYSAFVKKIHSLDKEILPLLNRHSQEFDSLGGIAIHRGNLGGFASSRLLLVTLNLIAWMKGIPARAVDLRSNVIDEAAIAEVEAHFSERDRYDGQILPKYAEKPDVTKSKKKKKFTVN